MNKVIVIDDEPLARVLIRKLLEPHDAMTIVAECGDGFDGYKAIQEHKPDLLFLDVQMPRINGFEMLELLDEKPSVIFTTAFDQFAVRAFEAHAIDYLLKPITRERFDKAVSKWRNQVMSASSSIQELAAEKIYQGYQHRLVVKDGHTIRIIPTQDILYLEASDDYVRIHSNTGKYLKKATLGSIEQSLDPAHFIRIHRSYLIPVTQLIRIEAYEKESHIAWLQCGVKVPVSKAGMSKLKAQLGW